MKKQVTITISGTCGTGKTFLKYQIAKHLLSIGLDNVAVIEEELNNPIVDMIELPYKFVKALNKSKVSIKVEEKQLVRDLRAKGEQYKPVS